MDKRIAVLVNGLPGKMPTEAAKLVSKNDLMELILYSFTGPEITDSEFRLWDGSSVCDISLVSCDKQLRESKIVEIKDLIFRHPSLSDILIAVDFTHPSAVNENAEFYCENNIPFVMGTTGGDRKKLEQTIRNSSVSAVVAPNMAKQIVAFQAMMSYVAENFPGLFVDYSLSIIESHQEGKADTSGTAKAMVKYFNDLGIGFIENDIIKIRDPRIQEKLLSVSKKHLNGHGWHIYLLTSADGTVEFKFGHFVNGRSIYARGTIDAILFLADRVREGKRGEFYTMMDVLKKGHWYV